MTDKMTITEAIAEIKEMKKHNEFACTDDQCGLSEECADMAIEALEKQIPKKVDNMKYVGGFNDRWIGKCPVCGKEVDANKTYRYCSCGQAIDWESDIDG